MVNWKAPQYLQTGNRRQQYAYALLQELQVWAVLRDFDPVLAGTIPLNIDVPGSDLDVICEVPEDRRNEFISLLREFYGRWPGFQVRQRSVGGQASVVSNFRCHAMEVEVFGQALPTERQNAYRHLVVEHAILQAGGELWRRAVRQLKQQGLKTEPAFAQLLGLPGNPYDALLTLEEWPTEVLRKWLLNCLLP